MGSTGVSTAGASTERWTVHIPDTRYARDRGRRPRRLPGVRARGRCDLVYIHRLVCSIGDLIWEQPAVSPRSSAGLGGVGSRPGPRPHGDPGSRIAVAARAA